ncbi:MAG TPA: squalene synthase HpnC [Gaiellaceae bacterium]
MSAPTLDTPELALARIDGRSSGENFPVASLLAPRAARPHLRAVYGFARLVDNLGDEAAEGDRLALLDELERELEGPPQTEIMRRLRASIEARSLPLEPFRRLIEANRIDQRTTRYETWADVREYCTYSADPVGRLVLAIYGREEVELVAMSDDVCTGLQLVNFLQDPPRDLALGRVYLPLEDLRRFGVAEEELAGPWSERVAELLRFEADRARPLLRHGFPLGRALGGRIGRSVSLFARGGLAALDALEAAGWDVFSGRPAPSRFALVRLAAAEAVRPSMPRRAYGEAGRITRKKARSFAWGIKLLPAEKRRAVSALYAFARRVDDIADDPGIEPEHRRTELLACRAAAAALPDSSDGDLVLVALADAVARFAVPKEALVDLVDGGLMDVERSRYASWEDLRGYCRRVAGAVGVACCAVYGPDDREAAFPLAETLGLALQQINIMRDVAEDWRLGRVYLPQDELARFGVSEEDIANGRTGPEWHALMEHQAARADALLAEGLRLLPHLDRRSALGVRSFAGIYKGLLDRMREAGFDVFAHRPSLSALEKVKAVATL